jgi:4-hydroxy-3-polyprenylbenzoate decarboxylase
MLSLARLGTVVLPASPGFYHHPRGVPDMVDFVVARVLDHMELEHDLGYRWTGDEEA